MPIIYHYKLNFQTQIEASQYQSPENRFTPIFTSEKYILLATI
jgi:hypothetical protein